MLKIRIADELQNKVPDIQLFCIECDVELGEASERLRDIIQEKCLELKSSLKVEEISSLPAIRASRIAYKATGKDPARYRLSAEALLRRVVKGEELYRISNVVDLLNLVSITTGFSIGGYDGSKIDGDVQFGIGEAEEAYSGIGRGTLNIEGLPVFRDQSGAFGSPTSDSERTCVDNRTKQFLMVIIAFGTIPAPDQAGKMAVDLLNEFANASSVEIKLIR
jgi:DNA/RNA-binding domain of Phe-tRNA-synthetase-like protein